MEPICVAFKAHLGWVNAVAVAAAAAVPTCRDVARVTLVGAADREAREPYHVAGGWDGLARRPRPADPAAVIRRGRRRQQRAAARCLDDYRQTLDGAGMAWTRAVVLTGRSAPGDDLERVLGSHAQIHVAEGEAVRDAIRAALLKLAVPFVEQDEKAVPALAGAALGAPDPDALLRAARPEAAAAWRKEERLLAMAAWLHRR